MIENTEPESKKSTGFFTNKITVIGTIVSIAAGLIVLYNFISPDKPSLKMTYKLYDIPNKPGTKSEIQLLIEKSKSTLPTQDPNKELNKKIESSKDENEIAKYTLSDGAGIGPDFILRAYIQNEGKQEAKSCELELPFFPVFVKIDDTFLSKERVDGKTIKLGNIKPNKKKEITVWNRDFIPTRYEDESSYSLTFENGSASIQPYVYISGPAARIAEFAQFAINSPFLFSTFVLLIILLVLYPFISHKASLEMAKKNITDPTSTELKPLTPSTPDQETPQNPSNAG